MLGISLDLENNEHGKGNFGKAGISDYKIDLGMWA